MDTGQTTRDITEVLDAVQRRTVMQAAAVHAVHASWYALPIAAVLAAVDARWLGGGAGPFVVALAAAVILGWAARGALRARSNPLAMAVLLDRRAGWKSRVSTALSFLGTPLDAAREVQVRDAMAHLHAFDWQHYFAFRWPRGAGWAPVLALLAVAALWVPPAGSPPPGDPEADAALRAAQAAELDAARETLAMELDEDDPMAGEIQEELQRIAEELESGELDDRQAMIALSRMESALAERMQQGDLGALAQEARDMAAPLQSAQSTAEAGEALSRRQPLEAGEALREAGRSARQEEMGEDERAETAAAMRMTADRLREQGDADGQPRAGGQSFSHDLDEASDALDGRDGEAFDEAMRRMAEKLGQVRQYQDMEAMRQGMESARSSMAMAEGVEGGEDGLDGLDEGDDSGRGGTMAGTGTDPNLMGDAQRLEDSMHELMAVRGQLGDGPVQTRIEESEGRLSASAQDVRDLHAEYAAVAEEAIERESVPLSHRQHVRRYFEAIRPSAEQPDAAAQ